MRVLVTRPQPVAERTAQRLAARGHEAVLAPVLRIEATHEGPPSGDFAAIILTSANGVPALAPIAERMRAVPVFAVGERTGSAAAEAGFADVRTADGEAVSLAALITKSLPAAARLLRVAARERKPEPEASLTKAGFAIATWTAYEAVAAERLPAIAENAFRENRLGAVLHYSRRSAGVLLSLAGVAGVRAPFLALAQVCLSADTAAPLREAGAERVTIADRPSEDALLVALDGCKPR